MSEQNSRPPIVVILGHVDHGKTTLLDYIRKSNRAAKEAGGITQSIGAWQAETKEGKKVTFIDTPGHEAFKNMRESGVQMADIGILVVDGTDGVMPQTTQSAEYLQKSKTPFIVAINKIDLPSANPENVKNQLTNEGMLIEGKGGDIPIQEISAKTGDGVAELLEMINLLWEMQEIKVNPDGEPEAVVVETRSDKGKGQVASCIIKNGTAVVGGQIETTVGKIKIRGLFDQNGKPVERAGPGTPVEILGFSSFPELALTTPQNGQTPIVLKADTQGCLQALVEKLKGKVNILKSQVGEVSETDVLFAESAKAKIIAFNPGKLGKQILKLAEEEKVKIYTYNLIYKLLEEVETWSDESEEQGEKILGRAEILAQFPHNKEKIVGAKVLEGRLAKADTLNLVRLGKIVGKTYPVSIRKGREEAALVEKGDEFGVLLRPQFDFEVGDMLESVEIKKADNN